MMRPLAVLLFLIFTFVALAGPVILQMNKAFFALTDLIPFLTHREHFMEKKNEKVIEKRITDLQSAFRLAKHDGLLKEDLFAPSYAVINENIDSSLEAFKKGKKDYAHWRLKEITSHCIDCHTRLPPSHTSSFQNGELAIDQKKFDDVYNLGIAQLIVRRYFDAKNSFTRSIQDRIITKDFKDIILPFKQLLVIEAKVEKKPESLIETFKQYQKKQVLPEDVRTSLTAWIERLKHWQGKKELKEGLISDKAVETFIKNELISLKKKNALDEGNEVDLLFASGLLSNYLFENPDSKMAPDISYWLGWAEKYLKRESFFGPGDLFLKQCVKRYPKHPVAKKCLDEYEESIEFEFSGSSGTHIPADIQKELDDLEKLINKK